MMSGRRIVLLSALLIPLLSEMPFGNLFGLFDASMLGASPASAQNNSVKPVEIGASGTAPAGIRTPNFYGRKMLTVGYFKELARDVTGDAVDPHSDALIAKLLPINIHVDFSTSTANGGNSLYGIPINVVSSTQPLVPVLLGTYASESDPGLAPIPDNPSVENWYSAEGKLIDQATVNDGKDHHLLIAVRDEATGGIATLYELYQVWHDGSVWHAASNAKFDLTSGMPRRIGWTSGDAAGLPMLPLMPRYDEIENGGIRHAMRMTFNVGQILNRFVWPARHASLSGSGDYGIPFGARFRLKKAWYEQNSAKFSGPARAIVEAMRTYGVINADVGGPGFLSGVSDERYDLNNLLSLQQIPFSAFEMLKLEPIWTITGPDCAKVGEPVPLTINHYPDTDTNLGGHGLYIRVDGELNEALMNPAHISWSEDPRSLTQSVAFTAPRSGAYTITGDPGGEYYYAPPPLQLRTCD